MFTVIPLQRCYEGSSSSSSRMTGSLSNYDDHCYETSLKIICSCSFKRYRLYLASPNILNVRQTATFFRNVSKIKTGNGKLLSSVLTSSTQHRLWKFHVVIVRWTFRTKNFDTPAVLLCFS